MDRFVFLKNWFLLFLSIALLTVGNYPRLSNSSIILNNFYASDEYHKPVYKFLEGLKQQNNIRISLKNTNDKFLIIGADKTTDEIIESKEIEEEVVEERITIDTSKVLIIGDSRIQTEVGIELEIALKSNFDVEEITRVGIPKSGLSRPDFYDWNDKLETLITQNNFTTVVAMMGANDGQRIFKNNNPIDVKDEVEWNSEYLKRIKKFQEIATDKDITIIWIGNPISGLGYYNTLMKKVNSLTKQGVESNESAFFLDIWLLLANEEEEYSDFLTIEDKLVRIRTQDKIHMTRKGGEIIANKFIELIDEINGQEGVE
jgi:hypothetical protein